VYVEMKDRLPSIRAFVGYDAITAFFYTLELCYRGHLGKELAQNLGRNIIGEAVVVLFGDDEGMHRSLRIDIIKGYDIVIFVNDGSGDFASYELTKNAIVHVASSLWNFLCGYLIPCL